jgi:hypothetical protein
MIEFLKKFEKVIVFSLIVMMIFYSFPIDN